MTKRKPVQDKDKWSAEGPMSSQRWQIQEGRWKVVARDVGTEKEARLIAAAPELLAALERLVAWGRMDELPQPSLDGIIHDAIAVIAKAKEGAS